MSEDVPDEDQTKSTIFRNQQFGERPPMSYQLDIKAADGEINIELTTEYDWIRITANDPIGHRAGLEILSYIEKKFLSSTDLVRLKRFDILICVELDRLISTRGTSVSGCNAVAQGPTDYLHETLNCPKTLVDIVEALEK